MSYVVLMMVVGAIALVTSVAASVAIWRRHGQAWLLALVAGAFSFWFFLGSEFPPHGMIVSALLIVVAIVIREPEATPEPLEDTGSFRWRR